MKKIEFIKIDQNGKEVKCEVIATYHHKANNKNYMIYTDNTYDENNKLRVYYSLYELVGDKIKFLETEDYEDKKIGLELVKELLIDLKK